MSNPSLIAVAVACLQTSAPEPLSPTELQDLHQQRTVAAKWLDRVVTGLQSIGLSQSPAALRLVEYQKDLAFVPKFESPTPDGFPPFTPVNQIVLLAYPSYRMASVPNQDGSSSGFWTLFQHINRNDIAMTAPVQMDYAASPTSPSGSQMSFLYSSMELGKTGAQGRVQVKDVAPSLCLSIGVRGEPSRATRELLHQQLQAELEKYPGLQSNGDLRVMGWNSPFVPRSARYFEVQIPVRERQTTLADNSTPSNQHNQES